MLRNNGTHRRPEDVVLFDDYVVTWMAAIVEALVRFKVLTEQAVRAEDFDMEMQWFDDNGVVELVFAPSGFHALLRVVVRDESNGSIMLVVLMPSHDDLLLCETPVPRGSWTTADALA
jgi:hypothetical protein